VVRMVRQTQWPDGRVQKPMMPMRTRWSLARVLLVIAATLVVILGLAVVGGFFFLMRLYESDQPPGTEAAQPYVERYVQLLDAGDENHLRELLGDRSAPADAARRIAAYRGLGLRDARATVSDNPAGCSGDFPWSVTIKAGTSAGTVVTMHEAIDWAYEPSPHLEMDPLSAPTGYVSGTWRVKGAESDGLMRVRWTWKKGPSGLRVVFARFFDAPRKFVPADSSWKTSNGYVRLIRYVSEPTSSKPDVILFDHLADSITITDGRSGNTASLVRVSQ
jgi:hypothetical protein